MRKSDFVLIREMIRANRYREPLVLACPWLQIETSFSELRLAIDRQPETARTILTKKADSVL